MTILVGYTASKESKAALEEAIRIARSTHEGLLVVNAGPGGEHKHDSMVTEDQQLELQTPLDSTGLSAEFRQYARGRSTVDEIKDVADEVQLSVVVTRRLRPITSREADRARISSSTASAGSRSGLPERLGTWCRSVVVVSNRLERTVARAAGGVAVVVMEVLRGRSCRGRRRPTRRSGCGRRHPRWR